MGGPGRGLSSAWRVVSAWLSPAVVLIFSRREQVADQLGALAEPMLLRGFQFLVG